MLKIISSQQQQNYTHTHTHIKNKAIEQKLKQQETSLIIKKKIRCSWNVSF